MSKARLLTFVCNWCSYGGADAAGGKRLEHPAGVRLVRVMCSGRVDPQHVLEAFRNGADGVLILGCHPGDCHYKEGNYRARNRAMLLQKMLPQMGIDAKRLRLDWVGAAEAERFQRIVTETYDTIVELGPLHIDADEAPQEASV